MTAQTVCRHCRKGRVNRPRGLCWTCYFTDGVKGLYPSTSKYASKGSGLVGSLTDPEPTTALPGTPEKMLVLEERARLGQRLYHPNDAK